MRWSAHRKRWDRVAVEPACRTRGPSPWFPSRAPRRPRTIPQMPIRPSDCLAARREVDRQRGASRIPWTGARTPAALRIAGQTTRGTSMRKSLRVEVGRARRILRCRSVGECRLAMRKPLPARGVDFDATHRPPGSVCDHHRRRGLSVQPQGCDRVCVERRRGTVAHGQADRLLARDAAEPQVRSRWGRCLRGSRRWLCTATHAIRRRAVRDRGGGGALTWAVAGDVPANNHQEMSAGDPGGKGLGKDAVPETVPIDVLVRDAAGAHQVQRLARIRVTR